MRWEHGFMDFDTLRSFLAVADGATVTAVAERAHMTQPALSRALGRMEREAGTPLFVRVGRGLRLTPAGREFARHARESVEAYDRGLRAVTDLVDPHGGLVPLAFLHTLGTWLVPALIQSFRIERPGVRFDLRQHGDAGLVADLLSGVVDLAVTADRPVEPLIESRRLLLQPLRLVVPPDHRLAGRHIVRLRDLADEPFIVLRPGFSLRALTESLCAQAGFRPVIGFEGEEVETLRGLVGSGLGVALLPEPRGTGEPVAPHLRVSDVNAVREIGLAWLRDRRLPPASDAFRRHVLGNAKAVAGN
jgi:DNA-binding transcriptional LysR family regulator